MARTKCANDAAKQHMTHTECALYAAQRHMTIHDVHKVHT